MVAIVDYGVGNLFSLKSSLEAIGVDAVVTGDAKEIENAERIILPGVGAFSDAAKKLNETGLGTVIISEAKKGKPVMGICLGMQLLLEKSFEYGEHIGLGLIPGEIRYIGDVIPKDLKIPHIGWNSLKFVGEKSRIFKYLNEGDYVYFVHSYHAQNCPNVTAVSEYGGKLVAAVGKNNVYGCQFHPEKSGEVGLKILKAFCETEE
ncbi:MAG: imidazole glycerol phosphate synthase subunit HisH [Clostridia bacterium]|nr:imidazole glycerol phosphate synthase subunit HisH [Clostridia bacterium]